MANKKKENTTGLRFASIPLSVYETAKRKFTLEERWAFISGAIDAFAGIKPADPLEMDNPTPADVARYEGYSTVIELVRTNERRYAAQHEGGKKGGMMAGRGRGLTQKKGNPIFEGEKIGLGGESKKVRK